MDEAAVVKPVTVDLKSFLQSYGAQLSKKIQDKLTPVYDPAFPPSEVEEYAGRIEEFHRKLFFVQKEVVKGLALAFYKKNREHVFVVGEMGTGKTTIALSVAAVAPVPQRVLVVCPTHLVKKWIRETQAIIPDVRCVDLTVKNVISILQELRGVRDKPKAFEVYVISKEKAKLGYGWRPAAFKRGLKGDGPHCPSCGERAMNTDDEYIDWWHLERKKHKCRECGEVLWQADGKLKRFSSAEFIKKYLKGYFDVAILDEIQDYKAGESLQGRAMGALLSASKRCLALTGTLNGGYADDLFHLLFRMTPEQIKKDGFEHGSTMQWLETFGTLETVNKLEEEEDNYYGRGKKKAAMVRKRPGVSPVVIGKYLLDKSCFIRLADVIEGLPPYEENVVTIELEEGEQKKSYKTLEDDLLGALRQHGKRSMSAMLQALLSYPDSCSSYPEEIEIKDKAGAVAETVFAPCLSLGEELLPKEAELIELVKKEKAEGRKVLCYLTFTGERDIRSRLTNILKARGFTAVSLNASVEPKKREEWIENNCKFVDVLLVNPELVKTGLDLYDFPTIVFFQTGYSIFTLRQAARRSWRIGQTRPVKVYFFCYAETMQETAITLVAKKLEVALMVEGELPEGLAEYTSSGGSIAEEMGKALINGNGSTYGGAEAAWAAFRKKEIETQLAIGGKETIFTEKTDSRVSKVVPLAMTSVVENVMIKVSFFENKKKRQSTLEVAYGDLEKALKGKTAQFALF